MIAYSMDIEVGGLEFFLKNIRTKNIKIILFNKFSQSNKTLFMRIEYLSFFK